MALKKSAKARKRDRRKNNNTDTSESSEPSSALTTPRTSITSTTSIPLTPKESSNDNPNGKQQVDTTNDHRSEADDEPTSRPKLLRWTHHERWIHLIWPWRLYRWFSLAIPAFFRGLWRTSFESKILSLIVLLGVYFAFWSAVEGMLRMFRGVAAQTLDASCSIVYVTIPGPIVTVSLVGATPTDPARGTYYYSVINGSTKWLNSIAPPTRLTSFMSSTAAPTITPTPVLSPTTGLPLVSPQLPTPVPTGNSIGSTLSVGTRSISSNLVVPSVSLPSGVPSSLPDTTTQPQESPPFIFTSVITGSKGEPVSTLTLTSRSSIPPPPVGPSRPFPIPPASSVMTTDFLITPSTPSFNSPPGEPTSTELLPLPINSLPEATTSVSSFTVSPPRPSTPLSSLPATSMSRMSSGTPLAPIDPSTSVPSPEASVPSISGSDIMTIETSIPQNSASGAPRTSSGSLRSTISTFAPPSPSYRSSTRTTSSGSGALPTLSGSLSSLLSSSAPKGINSASTSLPLISRLSSSRVSPPGTSSGTLTISLMTSSSLPWTGSTLLPSSELNGGPSSSTTISGASSTHSASPTSLSSRSGPPLPVPSSRSIATLSRTGSPSSVSPTGTYGWSTIPRSTSASTGGVIASSSSVDYSSGLASVSSSSGSPAVTSSSISTPVATSSRIPPPDEISSRFLNSTTSSSSSSFLFASTRLLNTTSSSISTIGSSFEFPPLSSSRQSPTTASRVPTMPSPGWNRTTTSRPTCTGSVTSPGCESFKSSSNGEAVTRVIAYGNTEITFAFPSPDITTTVSYWTGEYPSITGSEPSPMLPTMRARRQTPLSALPPTQLVARAESTPTTLVTTIVSVSVTSTTDLVAAAEATTCGEYGNFTLGFDDSTTRPEENNVLPVAAIKNPYHHLFYSNGMAYVPDNWEPYPAISQPNVAVFLPITGLLSNNPFAGTLVPGELGAGPRASVDAYWFNAYSGFFGCALNGITRCTLRITGYRYDTDRKEEVVAAEQNVTIPACYGYINCRLMQVGFTEDFRALSGIQFQAYTYNLGVPQIFMMDDLQLEWYNNTCGAGILRIGHR